MVEKALYNRIMRKGYSLVLVLILFSLPAVSLPVWGAEETPPAKKDVEQLRTRVVASYPHDRSAFTQGLLWHEGTLYESTGRYGTSTVRKVAAETGRVLLRHDLDGGFFGEGLAWTGDRFIQLTWYAGVALVYDAELLPIGQMDYQGEGWGLTWDGDHLVMSNGSADLTFRSAETFEPLSNVTVTLRGQPLDGLNELEYVDGEIYANVWMKEWIARIDPETGEVTGVIDASGLLTASEKRRVDVLNGIAYDPGSKTFWITGKFWPKMFQVVFEPAS